jgi:hypothetical protein
VRVSRERLLDFLGITAITVVVWFYAAGQTLQTRVIAFDVVVDSGDPSRLSVTTLGTLHLEAEIRGSRQAVIRASESLSGRTLRLVTGADGVPAQPGEHDLPLKDVLSGSPSIAPLGVDITTVTPPVTRIEIRATNATSAPGAP